MQNEKIRELSLLLIAEGEKNSDIADYLTTISVIVALCCNRLCKDKEQLESLLATLSNTVKMLCKERFPE